MLHIPLPRKRRHRTAFSLVELLTVVALLVVLATMISASLDSSSQKFQSGLAKAADLFTLAHQHAVAMNTYVYVVFSEPDPQTRTSYAAIAVSKNGFDIAPFNSSGQLRQGIDFEAPNKIETFENIDFLRTLPSGAVIAAPAAENLRADEKTFSFARMPDMPFTRFVKFTPRGEARVRPSLTERVQLIMQPRRGPLANEMDVGRTSLVQISGLTGKVHVYQP